MFSKLLIRTDWTKIFPQYTTSSMHLVNMMNTVLEGYANQAFKMVTRKIKSSDPPWITPAIKRQVAKRKRIFRQTEQREGRWRSEKEKSNQMIRDSKKKYFDNEVEKLNVSGAHRLPYLAVKNLKSAEKPKSSWMSGIFALTRQTKK